MRFSPLLLRCIMAVLPLMTLAAAADPGREPETDGTVELGANGEVVRYWSGRPIAPLNETPFVSPGPKSDAYSLPPPAKISPSLSTSPDDELVEVVVAVRGLTRVPLLPAYDPDSFDAAETLAERQRILRLVSAQRIDEQSLVVSAIERLGGKIISQLAFGNAVVASLPRGKLTELAKRDDVVHVMPRQVAAVAMDASGQANTDPTDDASAARAWINSDPFYSQYGSSRIIGLIDTGVRWTHSLLYAYPYSPENRIRMARDCHCGGDLCESIQNPPCPYNGSDTHSGNGTGHGTKSASILSGRSSMGSSYRGVTSAKIDSWSWHELTGEGPAIDVFIKAVYASIFYGNAVVSASLGVDEPYTSSLSSAFDDAYDSGAVVVAANGNTGYLDEIECTDWPRWGSVLAPGNAHKVLGVGYYNVQDPWEEASCEATACDIGPWSADWARQSLGPTADGRVKPDIRMPTRSETGCRLSDTCITTYCHTSGATPYAAGSALLLWNFLYSQGLNPSPGRIYAAIIAFGDLAFPLFGNMFGAGMFRFGDIGQSSWNTGVRYVAQGQNSDLTFQIPAGACRLEAAIWWPEESASPETHADIDLYLYDGTGAVKSQSYASLSVFERIEISGNLSPSGTWKLRMRGDVVPGGASQTVYYFLYFKTGGC